MAESVVGDIPTYADVTKGKYASFRCPTQTNK